VNKFKQFEKLGRIAGIALLTASSNIALAQNDNNQVVSNNGDWEFALAPLFLWGMGISGDATIGDKTAPLDIEFGDIWSNLDAVFTLHFEARKDKWTIFSEIQYVKLKPDVTVSLGPVSADAKIEFENTIFELGGAYAFRETQNTRWELLGGIRYTDQDVEVDATLTLLPPGNGQNIGIDGGDNWSHAIVGTRFFGTMSDEWTFIARTDVGYGGSDNKAFNAMAMFDYRFRNWGSVFFGYRYLKYDYDNDKSEDTYAFDAYQSGPLAGMVIHW
jgi:hypothetical protein